MTKLDSISASLTSLSASSLDHGHTRRLIVLFPASASEDPKVSQRIWQIASAGGLDVLFISLCNEYGEEAQLRRKLITQAAIIKDGIVSTEIMIERGSDWVGKAKKAWRPGDILACYAGQKVGLMRKALDQVLRSSLDAPLYVFAEEEQTAKSSRSNFVSQTLAWVGSFAIIASFLWVEVQIVKMPPDWTHNLLLYVSLLGEASLIWGWNSIFM